MKEQYIDIIEQAVGAYTTEEILTYTRNVETDGLREHGYPRLTANIAILLVNGRRNDLKELLPHMMTLCCEQLALPTIEGRGNDFSVKEIVLALLAMEEKQLFPPEQTAAWRQKLAQIDPYTCYNEIAAVPPRRQNNWAAFAAASEQLRKFAGIDGTEIGGESRFIDDQFASQVLSFDENGMYRDPDEPMVYDAVTRLQMAVALHFGYDGAYREEMEAAMLRASLPTLQMQSVTGEIPFGGRSNQFLLNETFFAAICEYYAAWWHRLGDNSLAGQFRSAARLSREYVLRALSEKPICHVKNRYPRESRYGCEHYGYFNKYMVTTASWAYLAYLFADDSIPECACPAQKGGYVWQSSPYFHKVIAAAGGYTVEYDTKADPHYDANGLGRIHYRGAPSALCLTVPFPQHPYYTVDIENPSPLSVCGGIADGEGWLLGCDTAASYTLLSQEVDKDGTVTLGFRCSLSDGRSLSESCRIAADGVTLTFTGSGRLCCMIPAFEFDGQTAAEQTLDGNALTVRYKGQTCRWSTDGALRDTGLVYANRSGHSRAFRAEGENRLEVRVSVYP